MFLTHIKNNYHQNSIVGIENSRDIADGKTKAVDVQLDNQKEKVMKESREKLKHIIGAILLCGRQGIALRGHRDDGSLFQTEEMTEENGNQQYHNDGNFRAILRYRAESDDDLKKAWCPRLKMRLTSARRPKTKLSRCAII